MGLGHVILPPVYASIIKNTTELTTQLQQRLTDLLAERYEGLPVWVRPPNQGYERYSALSRTMLYGLAKAGRIKSVALKQPHQLRGIRLLNLPSILEHITKHGVEDLPTT